MAKPITTPVISATRFPLQGILATQPIYRFPKAHLLTAKQKQLVALDLLVNEVKPRHIRKCLGISSRQLKKSKQQMPKLYESASAEEA